jgi:predicted alpha/beta hydrolase family esterase
MAKTVCIFHGYGGNKPGTWLALLNTSLQEQGYRTIYPSFPFMGSSKIEDWFEEFKKYPLSGESLTIVGHSGGTTFAFYIAQHLDVQIDKMILVAPLNDQVGAEFGLTTRPGKEAENPFLRDFIHQNFDFDVIKSKVREFIFMLSDNDHLIPHQSTLDYFKKIFPNAKFVTLPNYGHVNEKAGITQMLEVFDEINTG